MNTQSPSFIILAGILLISVGIIWILTSKIIPLGNLPGDFKVEKPNFKFYFPLTTSIIISIILSLAFCLIKFFNKFF